MTSEAEYRIIAGIGARRADLVALTQDLIRIPTLNPPGRNYFELCGWLGARMEAQGWQVELIRAEGAIGDSERYPLELPSGQRCHRP